MWQNQTEEQAYLLQVDGHNHFFNFSYQFLLMAQAQPMGRTLGDDVSADFQQAAIQNVVASQGTVPLFQYNPIPDSTPRIEANDLERQRRAAPNQLLGLVASGDETGFTTRANQLGLVDPSASYLTAEQRYLEAARNVGQDSAFTAMQEGRGEDASEARRFTAGTVSRIVAREETPEAQTATSARLSREDYDNYLTCVY